MEFLVVVIAVTALIWSGLLVPRISMVTLGMAAIALGAVFNAEFYSIRIGPIPMTIDRALWMLLGLGVMFTWFRKSDGRLYRPSPVELLLLGHVLLLVVSTFTHDWKRNDNLPLGRLLFFQLIPISFFWIGRFTRFSRKNLNAMATVAILLGTYLALTGIAEKMGWYGLVWPSYIVFNENYEFLGRARGPFVNPVGNGIALTFCMACGCLLWQNVSQRTRAVLAVSIGIMLVGSFCTMTRSVWLATAVSAALIVWFAFPLATRGLLITSTAVFAILFAFVLSPYLNHFKRDRYVTADEMSQSVGLRPMLFAVAWEMARDKPLFGHGYGQYKKVAGPYHYSGDWGMPLQKVRPYLQHNIFLAYLAELGLVGMASLVLIFCSFLAAGFRLLRKSRQAKDGFPMLALCSIVLTVNFIINGVFHDVSLITTIGSLYFYVHGLTYSGLASLAAEGNVQIQSGGTEVVSNKAVPDDDGRQSIPGRLVSV